MGELSEELILTGDDIDINNLFSENEGRRRNTGNFTCPKRGKRK